MTSPTVGGPVDPQSNAGLNPPQMPQQPPPYGPGAAAPAPGPVGQNPQFDRLREGTKRGVDALFNFVGGLGAQHSGNVPPGYPQAPYHGAPPMPQATPQPPVYGAPPMPPGAPQPHLYGAPPMPPGVPQPHVYGAPPMPPGVPQPPAYGAPTAPQRQRPPLGQGRLAQMVQTPARLVEKGGDVAQIARAKNLTDPVIWQLEEISVQGPAGQRAQATGDFMGAATEFGIRLQSTQHILQLRWRAVQGYIDRGETVASAAQRYQISDDASLDALQKYALEGPARHEVTALPDADYEAVAQRYGLNDANRETLRGYAAMAAILRHPAPYQVQALDQVAQRYGYEVIELKSQLANLALQQGEPVLQIANRLQLTRDQQLALEKTVIASGAGAAVAQGASVVSIAQHYGLTLTVTSQLEDAALQGAAGQALRQAGVTGMSGMYAVDIQALAYQYGISPATASFVAARAAVVHGYNVPATAQRYGITEDRVIDALAQACIQGPAAAALQQPNATVETVAEFFGLTKPEHIEQLRAIQTAGNG